MRKIKEVLYDTLKNEVISTEYYDDPLIFLTNFVDEIRILLDHETDPKIFEIRIQVVEDESV